MVEHLKALEGALTIDGFDGELFIATVQALRSAAETLKRLMQEIDDARADSLNNCLKAKLWVNQYVTLSKQLAEADAVIVAAYGAPPQEGGGVGHNRRRLINDAFARHASRAEQKEEERTDGG